MEKQIIHKAGEITALMEKVIPELQSEEHAMARPCFAYSPGFLAELVWECKLSRGGHALFAPNLRKRYLVDYKLNYFSCEEGEVFFYDNVRCEVAKIDGEMALIFTFVE